MNPILVTLGLRLLKVALAAPKLRKSLTETIAAERIDVGPEVVAALSGDTAAIKLLSDQIDEAAAYNKGLIGRLEAQVNATRLDS